jgi:hypothetical protein
VVWACVERKEATRSERVGEAKRFRGRETEERRRGGDDRASFRGRGGGVGGDYYY